MNSKHSIERANERAGLNEKRAVRFTTLAYERGKGPESMPELERKYMESKEKSHNCKMVYYNDYCFVFSKEGLCITLYPVPEWFFHRNHCNGKEIIRNMKKYNRFNDMEVA